MKLTPAPSSSIASPPPDEGGLVGTFLRLKGRLRRWAVQTLGNEQEADDALYEAFARLWPRRQSLHTTADEEAVLTTTVRHISIDLLRQRKRQSDAPLEDQQLPDTPEDLDELEEQYQEVQALIAQHLSPLQQRLLQARDVEGRSYAQLAAECSMQEAAVRQQISRARKAIRQLYLQSHTSS